MNRSRLQHLLGVMSLSLLAACGGGGGGDAPAAAPTPSLALVAGSMGSSERVGGSGSADGIGAGARFNTPWGVATDSAGNVYVAERNNHTIRKITPAGVVTTLAGAAGLTGSADATGAAARFDEPLGIATDSGGNVYVADPFNQTIRKVTPAGVVTTLAGTAGQIGSTDGAGAAARFYGPAGVAADSAGNLYVVEFDNHTVRKITPAGVVTTLAGTAGQPGSADAAGAAARFNNPNGVATDSAGNVYVSDWGNQTIRKITPAGLVTTLAGTAGQAGSTDASGAAARFNRPLGIAIDGAGNAYVAEDGNHTLRKITPLGVVTTLAGTAGQAGSVDAAGAAARFNSPIGAAVDSAGNIYVTDALTHTLRKVTPAGVVTTLAGAQPQFGSTDGVGAAARFNVPRGIATDSAGNVYVSERFNHTIRKTTPAGVVTTLAGTAGRRGSADATGAAAGFDEPLGIATDSAGNLYVAEPFNQTIRKITPAGVVTTLAGTAGQLGSADASGAAARFHGPADVATDSAGNVYVVEFDNHTVRKITPAGVVTTLAGTAGQPGSADATGAAARLRNPNGVATDSAGNVYVSDWGNQTIRKITPTGVVTTLAGTAGQRGSTDASGAAARFNRPLGIATDDAGNVYVADSENHTIRKITPAGAVTTVVGVAGQAGFAPGALPGLLPTPHGVAVSGTSLYMSALDGVAVLTHRP